VSGSAQRGPPWQLWRLAVHEEQSNSAASGPSVPLDRPLRLRAGHTTSGGRAEAIAARCSPCTVASRPGAVWQALLGDCGRGSLGAQQRLGEQQSVSERADVGRRLDRSPAEQRRVHVAPAAGGFGHQTAKSAVKHSLRQPILDRHATSKAASRRKRGSSGTTLQWRELDNNIRELHEGVTRKNKTAKCEIRCSSFCARARASFSSPLQSTPPPGSSTTASRRRRSPGRGRQTIQPFSSQCDQRYSSASDGEAEVCVNVSLRCLIRTSVGTETEGCHASEGESDERPTG